MLLLAFCLWVLLILFFFLAVGASVFVCGGVFFVCGDGSDFFNGFVVDSTCGKMALMCVASLFC